MKQVSKVKKKPAAWRDPSYDFIGAVGRYLDYLGWYAVIVGPVQVQSWPGARPRDFELVIKFMGGKKK